MSGFFLALQLFITYVLFGNAFALLCLKLLKGSRIEKLCVLFVCLGLSPGIISLILYFSFLLLPGCSRFVYVGIVALVFAMFVSFSWTELPALAGTYRSWFRRSSCSVSRRALRALLALVVLGATLLISFTAVFFPLQGHDVLQHAYAGRMLAQDRSLEHSPLTAPDPNGFAQAFLYPPGLHLIYAWTYLLQGTQASDVGVRLIGPIYLALTLLLLWRWGETIDRGVGILAVFALATVPRYMLRVVNNPMDIVRIFFYFSAFFWVWQLGKLRSRFLLVMTSVALAIAAFIHAVGMIALPVAGALYSLLGKSKTSLRRVRDAGLLVLLAGVLGGAEYIRRLIVFGTWRGPDLQIPLTMDGLLTAKGFDSTLDIIRNGVLALFTMPKLFGIIAWMCLASALILLLRKFDHGRRLLAFAALCSLLSLALIWVAPIFPPGWLTPRYAITVAPFLALCSGAFLNSAMKNPMHALGRFWERLTKTSRAGKVLPFRFACAVSAVYPLALSVLLSPSHVAALTGSSPVLTSRIVLTLQCLQGVFGCLGLLLLLKSVFPRVRWGVCPERVFPALIPIAMMLLIFVGNERSLLDNTGGRETLFGLRTVLLSDEEKLTSWGYQRGYINLAWYTSTFYIRNNTAEDAFVLVTVPPSYFYYANRAGISWKDLRMLPFYQSTSAREARDLLLSLGVDYVQVSPRDLAKSPISESKLAEILSDEHMSTLVWESDPEGATYIFKLENRDTFGD